MSWVQKRIEEYQHGTKATFIEKVILAHADPINLLLFIGGLLILAYGLWQHDWYLIFGGAGIGIVGDIISWLRK